MTDCVRKLRQERGASVVFALVIFLIVTIFSWTMVNGALTAAQNASMQREEEQAYLSVTSAARLFCREAAIKVDYTIPDLPSSAYSGTFDWGQIWNNSSLGYDWGIYDSDSICLVKNNPDSTVTVYTPTITLSLPSDEVRRLNVIQNTFLSMMKEIDKGNTPAQKTLTMTYPKPKTSGEPDIKAFKKVAITVHPMNPDYSATVDFENAKNLPDDLPIPRNLKYYVSVTFTCTKTPTTPIDNGDGKVKVSRTMEWTVGSVERGRSSAS